MFHLKNPTPCRGEIYRIYICPHARAAMSEVDKALAVAGAGLEGDRYHRGEGTFSNPPSPNRQITLIEAEALEALERDHGIPLEAGESRRNLLTRGISLNSLVGKEFRAGGAILKGLKLCEPCSHLEGLTGKALVKPLTHRGGLRAEIVTTGIIRRGDLIEFPARL